jgi:hypothetical protein
MDTVSGGACARYPSPFTRASDDSTNHRYLHTQIQSRRSMAGSSAFLTPRGAGPSRMRSAGPCPHYQRTGVCLLGNLCLYDHSQESRREGLFTQNEDYVALDDPTVELEAMLAMRTGELESMRAKLREMYRAQGVATSERGGIAGESQFQSEGLAAFPPREQEIIRRHVGGADADRQRKGKKRKRGGRTLTHAKRERNRLREDRDRGEVAGRDRHDESRSASPAASEQHTLLRNAIPSSSVLRLDNRPKRMIIAPIEPGSDKDEVLRRYLQVRFTPPYQRAMAG